MAAQDQYCQNRDCQQEKRGDSGADNAQEAILLVVAQVFPHNQARLDGFVHLEPLIVEHLFVIVHLIVEAAYAAPEAKPFEVVIPIGLHATLGSFHRFEDNIGALDLSLRL